MHQSLPKLDLSHWVITSCLQLQVYHKGSASRLQVTNLLPLFLQSFLILALIVKNLECHCAS